jgi:hypothetical protein
VSRARTAPRRTLWEEGRHPGRLVRTVTATVLLGVALADTLVFDRLTLVFDITFVVTCVAAALAVRPRDFFIVGVLPPLSMLVIVAILAGTKRVTVADPGDGLVQATVSGLAHHAGALVVGYSLTLLILLLRQVAYRNAGTIRTGARNAGAIRTDARNAGAIRTGARPARGSGPRSATARPAQPRQPESPMPTQGTAREPLHHAR